MTKVQQVQKPKEYIPRTIKCNSVEGEKILFTLGNVFGTLQVYIFEASSKFNIMVYNPSRVMARGREWTPGLRESQSR